MKRQIAADLIERIRSVTEKNRDSLSDEDVQSLEETISTLEALSSRHPPDHAEWSLRVTEVTLRLLEYFDIF